MNRHIKQQWGDSRTRLRGLARLASSNPELGLSSKGGYEFEEKQRYSKIPKMNIWDALVVSVGLMQLIEAAVAHREQGFWTHSKCVIFQLLRIFGPVVYLRESADDFKCELIVSDEKYTPSKKIRGSRNYMEQENITIATLQKQRHNGNPLSRFNIPCCRRELAAAAAVGIAALLSLVAAICKVLFLSSNEDAPVDQDMADCVATLDSASVHMYLLGALLTLWKSPQTWLGPWSSTCGTSWYFNIGSIEMLGDAFFGAASLVDVYLQHSGLFEGIHRWCVVSALLWTISSWFYVLAKSMR